MANRQQQGSPMGGTEPNQVQVIENTTGIVQIGTGPGAAILDQHQAIVSSTFANLELTSTKATLQQYVDLYEAAKRENARLAAEVQERDKDALQVVEFLRFDIEEKNTSLREAEQKLARVREEMRQQQEFEVDKWKQLVEQKDETIGKNKNTIQSLHTELESVALFKREKQELFLEVGKHKEQHASTVNRYEKELTKLRFQALEDKVVLRAAEKDMVTKFNEEVDSRAMLLVNTKAKHIHRENQRLQKDQRALTVEVGRITTDNEAMKHEVHEVRREAQLGRELQKEYARQGVKLGSQTKDATTKAKHLEDKLSTVVTAYEEKLEDVQRTCYSQVKDLHEKLDASQRTEKILRSELVKLRKLSQRIVSERSELEVFFHDALEHVKFQQQQLPSTEHSGGRSNAPRSPRSTATSGKVPRLPSVEGNLHYNHQQPQSARSARTPNTAPTSIISRGSAGEATVLTARTVKRDNRMLLASAGRENRATAPIQHALVDPAQPGPGADRGELVPSREGNRGTMDPEDAVPDFRGTPTIGGSTKPAGGAQGMSFGSLSWSDKETVIRALLYKINQSFYNPQKGGGGARSQQHFSSDAQQHTDYGPGNGVETFLTDPEAQHGVGDDGEVLQGPEYEGYEVVDEPLHHHHPGSASGRGGLGSRGGMSGVRPGTGDSIFGQSGPYRMTGSSAIPSSAGSAHPQQQQQPQQPKSATGVRYPNSLPTSSQSQRPATRGTTVVAGGTGAAGGPSAKKIPTPLPGSAGPRAGLPPHPPSANQAKSVTAPAGGPRVGSGSVKLRDGLVAINNQQQQQAEDSPGSPQRVTDPSVE